MLLQKETRLVCHHLVSSKIGYLHIIQDFIRPAAAIAELWPQVKALPVSGGISLAEIVLEKQGSRAEEHLAKLLWYHSVGSGTSRNVKLTVINLIIRARACQDETTIRLMEKLVGINITSLQRCTV